MDRQDTSGQPATKPAGIGTLAPRKPYVAPRLTLYGHISKLTTGSSGTKNDGGATRRRCL